MNKLKLLRILDVAFMILGIAFLCISIFTEPKNNNYLCIALASIIIANLLNLIINKIKQ